MKDIGSGGSIARKPNKIKAPTCDEWIKAMGQSLQTRNIEGGLTVYELGKLLGCGVQKVRNLLRTMIASGDAVAHPRGRKIVSLCGTQTMVVCYGLTKKGDQNATNKKRN